jgi:hypothetical protein
MMYVTIYKGIGEAMRIWICMLNYSSNVRFINKSKCI